MYFSSVNIEENPKAAERVIKRNQGKRKVSSFEVDELWVLVSPFDPNLLSALLGLGPA